MRRMSRAGGRQGAGRRDEGPEESTPRATAQEPGRARLGYGNKLRVATINVRSMIRAGKREEVEEWMKEKFTLGLDWPNVSQHRTLRGISTECKSAPHT